MGCSHAIRSLVHESERYLARFAHPRIAEIRNDVARLGSGPINQLVPQAPACGFLNEAIAAIADADSLRDALRIAQPFLHWVTYDAYPATEIGPGFPKAHAFASIIGGQGFIHASDWELGLFVIAPGILYRDHHHAAPELYAPLTGPHRWRFGVNDTWQEKPPHEPVWNEPWAVHATLTGDVPFLCLFVWTHDVDLPAKVVHAEDWHLLES